MRHPACAKMLVAALRCRLASEHSRFRVSASPWDRETIPQITNSSDAAHCISLTSRR
jgi:hypothetical protein